LADLDNRTSLTDKTSAPNPGIEPVVIPTKKVSVRTKKPQVPKVTKQDATGPLPELSTLAIRVPISLLRSIRLQAALNAKSLEDFVREAIEEQLRTDDGPVE
jgi:hypothetical protein